MRTLNDPNMSTADIDPYMNIYEPTIKNGSPWKRPTVLADSVVFSGWASTDDWQPGENIAVLSGEIITLHEAVIHADGSVTQTLVPNDQQFLLQ